MKITAIMSGWDWNDASIDFLVLPEGSDTEALNLEYRQWYRRWDATHGPARTREGYRTFVDWLKAKKGAVKPSAEVLEEFWEN